MKQCAWDVYLFNELIDTVWFDCDMKAVDVRESLVNHDGYDRSIRVKKVE